MTITRFLYYIGGARKVIIDQEVRYRFNLWHPITFILIIILFILGSLAESPKESIKDIKNLYKDGIKLRK